MYRCLDDRQTEAIRYIGEHPELLTTEEPRELFQVFGNRIEVRVDAERAENRERELLDRLNEVAISEEENIGKWLDSLISERSDLNLSNNPTHDNFVMRRSSRCSGLIR